MVTAAAQLAFDFPTAGGCTECGGECRSAIEDYRCLCDRCILRATIEGQRWHEDPGPKRLHLVGWYRRHGQGQLAARLASLLDADGNYKRAPECVGLGRSKTE